MSYVLMYECTCNTMKSFKVIKITIFDQNQFMTCYLIFNFRPTYFSYFRKTTAISISHNVKKQMVQKWTIPVVKGLTYRTLTLTQGASPPDPPYGTLTYLTLTLTLLLIKNSK